MRPGRDPRPSRQAAARPLGDAGCRLPSAPDGGGREALADIRDALAQDDPELARSLGRLAVPPHLWLWWVGGLGCLLITVAAVWALGPRAVGAIGILLVLGSPLVAVLASGPDDLVEEVPTQRDGP